MRIAWFSPLNTASELNSGSLSAYFSDQVLPFLAREHEIELFHDRFEPYQKFPTFHYLSAFKRHQVRPFDVFFYQLEDSRRSVFTRFHLALLPGVVLFHDFLLSDDGPEPLLNSPCTEVIRRFNNRQHPWPDRAAEFTRHSRYALREASFAGVALFSSERWHDDFRRMLPERLSLPETSATPTSFYLPYPVNVPEKSSDSIAGNVAFCGSPQVEDRAHKLLQALSELQQPWKLRWLLQRNERARAEQLLNEFAVQGTNVELVFERSPHLWEEILQTAQVAVHSHFSVYGQPGVYLAQSLARGLPCVVTEFGVSDYLSEAVVIKVWAGDAEASQLKTALSRLLGSRPICNEAARSFALETYHTRVVAQDLSSILTRSRPYLEQLGKSWNGFERDARQSLIVESAQWLPEPALWEKTYADAFRGLGWT